MATSSAAVPSANVYRASDSLSRFFRDRNVGRPMGPRLNRWYRQRVRDSIAHLRCLRAWGL